MFRLELVEPMGFEPTASSMPSRRAPNCATAPPKNNSSDFIAWTQRGATKLQIIAAQPPLSAPTKVRQPIGNLRGWGQISLHHRASVAAQLRFALEALGGARTRGGGVFCFLSPNPSLL